MGQVATQQTRKPDTSAKVVKTTEAAGSKVDPLDAAAATALTDPLAASAVGSQTAGDDAEAPPSEPSTVSRLAALAGMLDRVDAAGRAGQGAVDAGDRLDAAFDRASKAKGALKAKEALSGVSATTGTINQALTDAGTAAGKDVSKVTTAVGAAGTLAGGGTSVADAAATFDDPEATGRDKARSVSTAVDRMGMAGGRAGKDIAGLAGDEALGDRIGKAGTAASYLGKGGVKTVDALDAYDAATTDTGKVRAVASGVGGVSGDVSKAAEQVAQIAGEDETGAKIALGGSAVGDVSDGTIAVTEAVDTVREKGAKSTEGVKAIAEATGSAGNSLGSAGDKIARIAGKDETGAKIGLGGSALKDLSGSVVAGTDATAALGDDSLSNNKKTAAVLDAIDKGSTSLGSGADKVSRIAGKDELGGKLAMGADTAAVLARGGKGVTDAVEVFEREDATTADKVGASATATSKVSGALGTAGRNVATLSGDAELGGRIATGGSAVSHTADAVASGAGIAKALDDDTLDDLKKTNKVLAGSASITKSAASATKDVTSLLGKEDVGNKVGQGGDAVANVLTSGTDITAAIDGWDADGANANSRTRDVTRAVKSTGNALAAATATGFDIAGNKDTSDRIKMGSGAITGTADAVIGVTNAIDVFDDETADDLRKTQAVYEATKGVTRGGVKSVEAIANAVDAADVAKVTNKISTTSNATFGVADAGFSAVSNSLAAKEAWANKDYVTAGKRGLTAGGNVAQVVKSGADLTGMLSKTPGLQEAAKQVSGVAGTVGGTLVSGVSAVDNAVATGLDAQAASKLTDGSDVGRNTMARLDEQRAVLAARWGIDTTADGWQKAVDDRYMADRNHALAGGETAYTKWAADADIASFETAKSVDDIRKYARNQKMAGTAVKGLDTAGDVANTVGTATAAADGGATKLAGAVMKGGAMATRLGKAGFDRAENISTMVDATDIMNGYDKQGFFGRNIDKGIDAVKSAGTWVGDQAMAAGKAISDSPVGDAARWLDDKAGGVGTWAKDKATAAGSWAVDKGKAVGSWAEDKATSVASWADDKASAAGKAIKDTASSAWSWLGGAADEATETASSWGDWAWNGLSAAGRAVADSTVGKYAASAANTVGQGASWVGDKVGAAAGKAMDAVSSYGAAAADKATAAATWLGDKANTLSDAATEKVIKASAWMDDKAMMVSEKVQSATTAVVNTSKEAVDWAADKAKAAGGKVAELAQPLVDKAKVVGGHVADTANKVGGYVADKASAAGSYVADKASAAGSYVADKASAAGGYVANKAGQAWDATTSAAKSVAEAASPYTKPLVDAANTAGSWVKDKATDAGAWAKDTASAAGSYVADKAGQAWDGTKDLAGKAGTAIANSAVGQGASWVADKAGDAVDWVDENVWETSDMKWARKVGAFFIPKSSDKMLADTKETWSSDAAANTLKSEDYAKYKDVDDRMGGNTQSRNVNQLLKVARGETGTDKDVANAKSIFEALGVDPTAPDAEARAKAALAW